MGHTYIIGHYSPLVSINAQLLTPLMLSALIVYVSGWTYSLTSTPDDRFLRNFVMACLFTLRVFARNLLRGDRRRNTFHISFLMTDLGLRTQAFESNKPPHYILDHGDFNGPQLCENLPSRSFTVRLLRLDNRFIFGIQLRIVARESF